ncbi:MAG: BolA family transcriptional regulator [Aquimonas sp.]|nr:BolA family transcriptional regulator [Aquimonas sp.]
MSTRVEKLRAALLKLQPSVLEVNDDSHKHVGHEGARDGRGHFSLLIVSAAFSGLSPLARHRAVYEAVGELMQTDIHALSMRAFTPEEFSA